MCGFLAQLGYIVICGDAAEGLGDSMYESVIYVRGKIQGLGADAQIEKMKKSDYNKVAGLLRLAGLSHDPKTFKRVASAKTLYHFDADKNQKF